MEAHFVKPGDLSADQVSLWRRFQDLDPALANPYFCPDFSLAVGAIRDDLYVGVMEVGRATEGLFQSLPPGPLSAVPHKAFNRIERYMEFI